MLKNQKNTKMPGFILRFVCSYEYAVIRRFLWWAAVLATFVSFIACRHSAGLQADQIWRMTFRLSLAALCLVSIGGILIGLWRQQRGQAYQFFACSKKVMSAGRSSFPLKCKLTTAEIDELLRGIRGRRLRLLMDKMEQGDAVWQFSTDRRSWMALAGQAGYMICRGDQEIASMLTLMS